MRPRTWVEEALFSDWPEPRLPWRFPAPDHGATALRYALGAGAHRVGKTLMADLFMESWRSGPVVDLLDVLARYARYAPRTPEAVAARVNMERHLKVQNWVAEGLIRRANMPLPHKWPMNADGTWTQIY